MQDQFILDYSSAAQWGYRCFIEQTRVYKTDLSACHFKQRVNLEHMKNVTMIPAVMHHLHSSHKADKNNVIVFKKGSSTAAQQTVSVMSLIQ